MIYKIIQKNFQNNTPTFTRSVGIRDGFLCNKTVGCNYICNKRMFVYPFAIPKSWGFKPVLTFL